MTTKTESLIERARLTEEELEASWSCDLDGYEGEEIANHQLAKVFREVVKWLAEQPLFVGPLVPRTSGGVPIQAIALSRQLAHQLEAAGLERLE